MRTLKIFIFALGFAGIMSSCSEFLKEDPYSYVGMDEVGNDDDAVNLFLTGHFLIWVPVISRAMKFRILYGTDVTI